MSKKQKSAVLNQTVFPHELNTGVTIRLTEFAVVNKGCSFIDSNTIQRYVVMYLAKYGVPKDVVNQEYKTGNQFDHRWRDRDVKFRISSEGESTNLLVKIYAQFFTKGYIMNGYVRKNKSMNYLFVIFQQLSSHPVLATIIPLFSQVMLMN